jgi:hypothetical protein
MIFPLLRALFQPLFGSALSSTRTPSKHPSGFRTIGGGDGEISGADRRRGPTNSKHHGTRSLSLSGSEERIVNDMKMENLKIYAESTSIHKASNGIIISNEFHITEDRVSRNGKNLTKGAHEAW